MGILTDLGEVEQRLVALNSIGSRHAHDSLAVRRCFSKILTLGHAPSANLARVGLAHAARCAELDSMRDEHLGIVRGLVAAAQQVLREINAAIELTLVGRSRLGGATCRG